MGYYVNPGSCLFVGIFFPIVGALAVAARFLVRRRRDMDLWFDDWFSLAALPLSMGVTISLAIGGAHHAYGTSFNPEAGKLGQTAEQWLLNRKLLLSIVVLRDVALGFIKLSILYFYKRVFSKGTGRLFHAVCDVTIALISCWMVAYFITALTECGSHIELEYDIPGPSSVSNSHCFDQKAWNLSGAVTDVIFDIAVLLIPCPVIWRLQMTTRKKVATQFVFLMGAFAIALSLVRLAAQTSFNTGGGAVGMPALKADPTIAVSFVLFWTALEVGVAQVVCCLPSLWIVVERPGRALEALGALRAAVSRRHLRSASEASEAAWPRSGGAETPDLGDEQRGRAVERGSEDSHDEVMMREAGIATLTPLKTRQDGLVTARSAV